MPENHIIFIIIGLAITSFLYSSVGHGGASGYLAVLSLIGFTPEFMKPTALILNIFVSLISFLLFYKQGFFKWKLFYPFIILSIPFSFLGGLMKFENKTYQILLGIVLIFAVLRLLFSKIGNKKHVEFKIIYALIIGAIIGFLSGLLGIGGGIILTPIIIIFGWVNNKEAAPISALFIFVNSISGLIGFLLKGQHLPTETLYFVPITIIGGIFGAFYGSKKFSNSILQKTLAIVMIIAIVKLIMPEK